ncbi:GNAT family N-acetyltransferase [Terrimonas pollutisoli]|uniref:GNAT family N-acetyltransferase n=1 Tax=Terrimonas pollutisoli TaxID=3034147 RepID=UPI0023ED46AF|nr:GNAT family N-acetyltransferase [Terrimonas sp. H1YJ31]
MLQVRKVKAADYDKVWEILEKIIRKGDSFACSPASTKKERISYWCGLDKHTYVAVDEGEIAGTFFIQDNQPGLGSHIANAGYAVSPAKSGKGIGKFMGEYSLAEAKKLGNKAMQFNLVVKSNDAAIQLWKTIGFQIIGEIPEAFDHIEKGLTNAYIMYQKLN